MTFEELLISLGFNSKQILFILVNITFDKSRMEYDDKGNRIPIKHQLEVTKC